MQWWQPPINLQHTITCSYSCFGICRSDYRNNNTNHFTIILYEFHHIILNGTYSSLSFEVQFFKLFTEVHSFIEGWTCNWTSCHLGLIINARRLGFQSGTMNFTCPYWHGAYRRLTLVHFLLSHVTSVVCVFSYLLVTLVSGLVR